MSTFSIDVDQTNFQEVVLEGSKRAPVVIDFWAPWCAPCRALKPVLEKLAAEYEGRFTLAKINSDENQDIAANFGVRGIPAVKAVVDGRLVDEFVGAQPESAVRAFIERILPTPADLECTRAEALVVAGNAAEAVTRLQQVVTAHPRHARARTLLVEALLALDRTGEAREAFEPLLHTGSTDAPLLELKARLEFAGADASDTASLQARIDAAPDDLQARLDLARSLVSQADYEPALAQLLEIVRRDRKFGDDVGRRTMIEVFNLLGGQGELVSAYRRLLASSLY
jgi:putative thioredoxin